MQFNFEAPEKLYAAPARSGREKVAILLLALGKPLATKLLQSFDSQDVKAIMSSAQSLGKVDKDDLEQLVDEFAAQFAKTLGLSTDFRQVKSLVEQAFAPDQLNTMLGDVPLAPGEPIWRKFSGGSENVLVPYLLDEHPQTVTYVLTNLDAELAARCLAMLPRDLRDSVARRMLKLQAVPEKTSDVLQACMQQDLLSRSDAGAEDAGRSRVASIMNKLDRDQSEAILESLMAARPEEAKKLRGMIFSFEDLGKLSQPHRLSLFDKVATEQVIPALRGMDAAFKEMVLSAMGARARRMVEAELQGDTGQVTKETQAARRAIADLAISMAARGDIALPSGEEAAAAA
jgi:flagellar motor switch protein FliG